MLSRKSESLLTTRNPLKDSPFSLSISDGAGGMPPTTNNFLLLEGTNVLLLDGSDFLLLE